MFPVTLRANGTDSKGFLLNTLEVHLSFLHIKGLHSPHILMYPLRNLYQTLVL